MRLITAENVPHKPLQLQPFLVYRKSGHYKNGIHKWIMCYVLCICTWISIYSLSQYPSAYSNIPNSFAAIYQLYFCELKKEKMLSVQLQVVTLHQTPPKNSVFVNTNINISPNLCGAVTMNGGLADWFSFLTRAVERQFNLFSSLLLWETIFLKYLFYIYAFLSKNVNMTLSALSTFSAVTDITWPQFTEGMEQTHPCSTIWIYYHPEMSCIQCLRIILEDVEI